MYVNNGAMNEVGLSIKSGNAVKSQIYIALICYLSLEFIRGKTKKKIQSFFKFCRKNKNLSTFLSISKL